MIAKCLFPIKYRLLHIFSFLLVLSSCSSSPELVKISLELEDISRQWVYLCHWNGNRNIVVDSAKTSSRGKAKLQLQTSSADLYAITVDKKEFPIIIVANPGDRITLSGRSNSYSVVGSKESAELKSFQNKLNDYRVQLSRLRHQLPDSINSSTSDSIAKRINLKIDSLKNELTSASNSYVRNNFFALSSILVLTARIGQDEVLPYAKNRALFIKVDSCLNSVYADKPVVKSFRNHIYSKEKFFSIERGAVDFKPGDYIPPVSFNLVDGRTVSIPGLWAKLILIDFWANWCGTCKDQPYNFKPINNEFAKKGLQIIQVAADFNPDSLHAITIRDSLSWMHMAEENPYHSQLFKSLGVIKLPANFLIDRWGRIVATNIYGDSLTSTLHSFLDVKVVKPRVVVDSTKAVTPVQQ